jgi:hypothetical protein
MGILNLGRQGEFTSAGELLDTFPVDPFELAKEIKARPHLWSAVAELVRVVDVKSAYGKIGNQARNRKLTPEEREASARHAAQARWSAVGKAGHIAFGNGHGNGNGTAAAGGAL